MRTLLCSLTSLCARLLQFCAAALTFRRMGACIAMLLRVNLGPLTMNGVGQATLSDSAHNASPSVFYRFIYPAS